MKTINECKHWVESHMDMVIDLVRIYLGIGLFVKGLYFLMHQEQLPAEFIETILTGWWTTCLEVLPAKERRRGKF